MKRLLGLAAVLFACGATFAENIKLVDANDGQAIHGATVFSKTGIILGITDDAGEFSSASAADYPLSVRSIGYEPATVSDGSGTVRLTPATYALKEVTVTPDDRPITKIVCFIREYCSSAAGPDTMQMYTEHMAVAYGTEGKVKGYSKGDAKLDSRSTSRYARVRNSKATERLFRPTEDDLVIYLSMWDKITRIPFNRLHETEKIKTGSATDIVPGKYFPAEHFRKLPNAYIHRHDNLADRKEHTLTSPVLKILGLDAELTEATSSIAYSTDGTDHSYGIDDLVYGTTSVNINGRGRYLKKIFHTDDTVVLNTYVEVYPVEVTHLTIDEYKADKKEKGELRIVEPENLLPLSPALQTMVDRLKNEIP